MSVLLRYCLEEEIGRGATGTVFRARERGALGRTVALKRMRTADVTTAEAAWNEARLLAMLDHPHVVRVFDVVPDGPGTAVVMAYAAGGSLEDRLDELGALSCEAFARIILPIADALASAHRAGILHGDVKPANILFTADGEPLLSDFGAARWLHAAARSAVAVGTIGYLDPELLHSPAVDARSDVYALGVTSFEALAGMLPFPSTTPEEVLALADLGHTLRLVDHAPGVPAPVGRVVHRAMARRPDDRFASPAAFADALRDALGAGDGGAPSAPRPGARSQRRRRSSSQGETPPPRQAQPGRHAQPPERDRPTGRRVPATAFVLAGLLVLAMLEVLLVAPNVARALVIIQLPFAVIATAGIACRHRTGDESSLHRGEDTRLRVCARLPSRSR